MSPVASPGQMSLPMHTMQPEKMILRASFLDRKNEKSLG